MRSWDGTVELAETVTVILFSVGIARSRVIRRNDSIMIMIYESPSLRVDPHRIPLHTSRMYVAHIVATLIYPCIRHRMSAASPFVVESLHQNCCKLSRLSQVATEVRVTVSCGDSLKSVRVNAYQNCQRVVHQPGPLVEGMTYRRKMVLFPLRTD